MLSEVKCHNICNFQIIFKEYITYKDIKFVKKLSIGKY